MSTLPDTLAEQARRHTVLVFASGITDTRRMEARLARSGVDYRIERMGMGSADSRAEFQALKQATHWSSLPQAFVQGEFVGGEPELLRHPLVDRMPRAAAWLGAAGLLPFFACAVGSHVQTGVVGPEFVEAVLAYGAVILAFMAGCQWGGAVAGNGAWPSVRLGLAVLPALAAWPALQLGTGTALLVIAAGFVAVYLVDVAWLLAGWWPRWYLRLRTFLTMGVLASLGVVALAL